MSPRAKKASLGEMTYEAALEELRKIVDKLEGGTASLEESVQLFERGQLLAQHCSGLLSTAEIRLRRLTTHRAAAGGEPAPDAEKD
jgi:exodeoxyribonuclease VII small subunit